MAYDIRINLDLTMKSSLTIFFFFDITMLQLRMYKLVVL